MSPLRGSVIAVFYDWCPIVFVVAECGRPYILRGRGWRGGGQKKHRGAVLWGGWEAGLLVGGSVAGLLDGGVDHGHGDKIEDVAHG